MYYYALDQIIQEETTVDSIFDQIDVYEEDEEELSTSIHGWLKSCLQFKLVETLKSISIQMGCTKYFTSTKDHGLIGFKMDFQLNILFIEEMY